VSSSSAAASYAPSPGLGHAWYREAAEAFRERIAACGERVPVVTGFFGTVPGGLMDGDIGRGYTDLCAALCAVGLAAEELQVWKEVDGIFTADPSKVPTARLLPSITPSEAAELTFYGSEVIHHLTLDQVIRATPPIPIRIKNVRNPRGFGTAVLPDPAQAPGHRIERAVGPPSRAPGTDTPVPAAAASFSPALCTAPPPPSPNPFSPPGKPKRPTAVTIKDNIAVINVHSNKRSISHGFFAGIFSILHRHRVSVDLVSTSEVHVSMAVHWSAAPSVAAQLARATEDLRECGDVSVLYGMAILSLVGAEMKNMIGIAGRMFQTLGRHSINIEMISQGEQERRWKGSL
jgi:aspartate kinase